MAAGPKAHLGSTTYYLTALLMLVTLIGAAVYWTSAARRVTHRRGAGDLVHPSERQLAHRDPAGDVSRTSIGVLTGFLPAEVGIPSFAATLSLFFGLAGRPPPVAFAQGASINVGGGRCSTAGPPRRPSHPCGALDPVGGLCRGSPAFRRAARNRANGLVADPISVVLVKGGALAAVDRRGGLAAQPGPVAEPADRSRRACHGSCRSCWRRSSS